MKPSRRIGLLVLASVVLVPLPALALPTPDAVIGTVQVLPVLFGAVGAGAAWAARKLWQLLGGHKDARRPLATMAAAFGVAWAVTSWGLVAQLSERNTASNSADLAQMLRCDVGFHEHRARRTRDLQNGTLLPRVTVAALAAELARRFEEDPAYDPLLLSALNTRTAYDSGFLGVGPEGKRRYFEYVPPKQLVARLGRVPPSERASRDVVIEMLNVHENDLEGFVPILREFASVRLIERYGAVRAKGKEADYGRAGPGNAPTLFVREDDGSIRPAVFLPPEERRKGWPVPVFKIHFDEPHVRVPNMSALLSAEEAGEHVMNTPVVFTFGAGYPMDADIAAEFAYGLFSLRLDPANRTIDTRDPRNGERIIEVLREKDVFLFDLLDASDERLHEIVNAIGGRPFLTVPINGMAYPFGMDVPRAVERAAREKGQPFRYLGSTLQMADAVARLEIQMKSVSATGVLLDRVEGFLSLAVERAAGLVGSTGLALVLLGFSLRTVFLPATVSARRVKRLQRSILASRLDYLARSKVARRYLRLGPLYELPGALANLVFLVPFFATPAARLRGQSFAWVADLAAPDTVTAAILAVLFGVLAALMSGPGRAFVIFAGSAVAIALLAVFAVPAGMGLYACGGLVVAIAAELLAERAAKAALRRLSLESPPRSLEVSGECLTLAQAADVPEVGSKASALGKVARAARSTDLFQVPPAVVFRSFDRLNLPDPAAFAHEVLSRLRSKLANAEGMTFAVRSSAPGEDGAEASQAGRYVSLLNVPFSEVPEAIRTVLASYGGEAEKRGYRVGVLVQSMAKADLAGVLFTRSPRNGALAHVNYAEGLGDRLVSGEVEATEVFIARRSGAVRHAGARGPLCERLFLAGMAIERLFGRPEDIEWAYEEATDSLFVLQARPITAVEYDPAVLREQEKHIASVEGRPGPEGSERATWKRSDVREVVEDPSGFAASVLRETYAAGGSLTVASRELGLHVPSVTVVPLFGRLYEKSGVPFVSTLRFVAGSYWMKRRLVARGWPARLRAECAAPLPPSVLDATEPRELARQIVAHVRSFIRAVYPLAVEATVLAKLLQPSDPPEVHTIGTELFADLRRAAETGDVRAFVARWGHRSSSDYDPAAPDFGEDPAALLRYAEDFRGARLSSVAGARPGGDGAAAWVELVQLKELTKDRAVRYLRLVRPALLRLAALLEVDPGAVFVLPIESLSAFGDGGRTAAELVQEVTARAEEQAAWAAVSLPDEVSLPDLEFLGASAAPAAHAGAHDSGARFVATRKAFAGRALHLASLEPGDDVSGAVLVTDMLRPSLVKFYGRVAGIVSERGAYLSHAAIVGREAGVPIVVLARALTTLPRGAHVSVSEDGRVSHEERADAQSMRAGAAAALVAPG